MEDPRYIKELATHHVGGYLKIAPEHTEEGPLSKMMKPGMGSYDRFKELFDTYSKQAGKEQYLIPYFISAHPGTRDEDMVNLALWLKKHRFRLDQVQNFYPSPLANSTTMYYTGKNPLAKIGYKSEDVFVPKGDKQRRLHKALLRYHDPANWPLIRQALEAMGKKHLIGSRRDCLVPAPTIEEMREARRQNRNTRPALTKHTPMATQRQTPATAKKRRLRNLACRMLVRRNALKRRLDVKNIPGNRMLPGIFLSFCVHTQAAQAIEIVLGIKTRIGSVSVGFGSIDLWA